MPTPALNNLVLKINKVVCEVVKYFSFVAE